MKRPIVWLILIALGAGGWFFLQQFDVRGLEDVEVRRKDSTESGSGGEVWKTSVEAGSRGTAATVRPRSADRLRIAAWDLDALSVRSGLDPDVEQLFARVVRQFDLVALQGLESVPRGVLLRLAELASDGQHRYALISAPTPDSKLAFLYDRSTLTCDVDATYCVLDPDQLLTQDPLVGWFRAVGPDRQVALTLSVVNYFVDPRNKEHELAALEQTFFRVQDDGRHEDDVILCGNLRADAESLSRQFRSPKLMPMIVGQPTDVDLQNESCNVVIDQDATIEITGDAGTFDFLRQFNLTLDQARRLSPWMPVWAELHRIEAKRPRQPAGEVAVNCFDASPGIWPITPGLEVRAVRRDLVLTLDQPGLGLLD